jgi:hypothetical protein
MSNKFPFKDSAQKPLRELWSRQAYDFLCNFFKTVQMDANLEEDDDAGIPLIKKDLNTGRDWRIPLGEGAALPPYPETEGYFGLVVKMEEDEQEEIVVADGYPQWKKILVEPEEEEE